MSSSIAQFTRAATALAAEARANAHDAEPWPEPVPLITEVDATQPYPVHVLPPVMRDAVKSYQAFGRQPISMVGCSALAVASLACQGLADVDRDGNLVGPCSLFFLVIGASGERKTVCDKRMARAARRWEKDERAKRSTAQAAALARLDAWQARRDGILARVKRLSGSTKTEDEADRRSLEGDLQTLDRERPIVPPELALFKEDVSPEALAVTLAEGCPSSSLWTDEGGLVVGSHAMGKDSAMRYLALLNRLWDGNDFDRRRTTRESVHIEGRRFTVSVMLQPAVAAALLEMGGGIARGTGNLARFLIAWPESTMGERLYRPGDLDAVELLAFDDRISFLLGHPLPILSEATSALEPPQLRLSRDAFDVWRELHDEVERTLTKDGEFAELADFAAKAAEQAARLACVMHVFEHGPNGEISSDSMEAGAALALWHLHEARRMLAGIGRAGETTDAEVLLHWLAAEPAPPSLSRILQFGPYRVRGKARRDAAVAKLEEHGLARIERQERATCLTINPAVARP